MTTVFVLLAIYQLKHWLADYPLQRPWMLGKFKETGWAGPLGAHAGVHALFTFSIALLFFAQTESVMAYGYAAVLAGFDFMVHFAVDRMKASPKLLGRWKPLSPMEYGTYSAIVNYHEDAARTFARAKLRGNTLFWWALGADQMAHHLTHYFIIWMLVR